MAVDAVIQATAASDLDVLALIERAQAGDTRAFEVLLENRFWRLDRLALSITGNEADARDALQDACLRAWRELPRLRDRSRFDIWLWRIVVNSCKSLMRGRRRVHVREIAIPDEPSSEAWGDGAPIGDVLSETDLIRRAFARLDPGKRTILVLHHVEERSVSEIAQLLHIPTGTVKWRLHAARRSLEHALELERR